LAPFTFHFSLTSWPWYSYRPRALPGDIVLISFSSAKAGEPTSQSRGASPIALSARAVCACLSHPTPRATPTNDLLMPTFLPIAQQPKEVDEIKIEAI